MTNGAIKRAYLGGQGNSSLMARVSEREYYRFEQQLIEENHTNAHIEVYLLRIHQYYNHYCEEGNVVPFDLG